MQKGKFKEGVSQPKHDMWLDVCTVIVPHTGEGPRGGGSTKGGVLGILFVLRFLKNRSHVATCACIQHTSHSCTLFCQPATAKCGMFLLRVGGDVGVALVF